jgi:cell wall-associated NlpC family hydrolase
VATRRTALRTFAALAATAVALTLAPRVAVADPSRPTIEAKRRLEQLTVEVETAAEHYNEARIALESARRESARAFARVQAKEAEVAAGQRGLGDLIAAAYRSGGGVDPLVALLTTSTPQDFLDRAGTIDAVGRNREGQIRTLRAARRALEHERQLAAEKVKAADAIAADMERTRRRIEKSVAEQEALVARLETADARRERLEREAAARRAAQLAAARAEAARRAAAEAARRAALRASRTRSFRPTAYAGPASGRASVAVAEAYRQLGKPYRWGAAGPDSFDCSGLTMWAWAKAGVSLPHHSGSQYQQGRHVSRGELQPGDLVFFGSPIHHVGIYVGGGNMISAPQTGDVVKVQPAFRDDYVGATRL